MADVSIAGMPVRQQIITLNAELAARDAKIAELRAERDRLDRRHAELTARNRRGVSSVGTNMGFRRRRRMSSGSGAREEWQELIREKMSEGMTRIQAVRAVNQENPGLQDMVVEEAND